MFLHTITPQGSYTSLDLIALPVWRLELAAMALPAVDPAKPPAPASLIALCIAYVSSGTKARAVIAAVDTQSAPDAIAMVETGMPTGTLGGDKHRLTESAKALYNVETLRKEADVIIPKIGKLADVYHALLDALGDVKASEGAFARSVGPKVKGVLEGWVFAVTVDRFDAWRKAQNTLWVREDERFDAPPAPSAPASKPEATTTQEEAFPSPPGTQEELGGKPPAEGVEHPKMRSSKERLRAIRAQQAQKAGAAKAGAQEPEVLELPKE